MARATTAKKRRSTKKVSVKSTLTNLNNTLINNSEELIETSVATGEKYQKLFVKSLKKTQPLVDKQVDIVFDTLESIKDQYDFGTVRFKKLIGWNDKTLNNWKKNARKNLKELRKNAEETVTDIRKTAEETVENFQVELGVRAKAVPAPVAATKSTKATKKVVKRAAKKATKKVTAKKAAVKRVAKKVTAEKIVATATGLKAVDGIGPKMEQVLAAGGIKTINGLAKASVKRVENVIAKSGSNFRAINPESWIAQAKKMAK